MSQVAVAERDPARDLTVALRASETLIENLKDAAGGDEDFLADLIEGETNVLAIIEKIDKSELEDRTEVAGLESTIRMLEARKERAEKRADTKRSIMAAALHQIGLRKHRTPLGTISVGEKPAVAIVIEEADVPARFWKVQAPSLDKKALNEALRARKSPLEVAAATEDPQRRAAALANAEKQFPDIPGATLSNGGVRLQIRR